MSFEVNLLNKTFGKAQTELVVLDKFSWKLTNQKKMQEINSQHKRNCNTRAQQPGLAFIISQNTSCPNYF